MPRNLLLNVSLTPIVEHDIDADRYVMYYSEFPEALAVGETETEAELNLSVLVELMWQERPKDLAKKLLENYINDSHRASPKLNISSE
jgi:predicted RNase H-like HicB family nuclease